MRVHKGNGWREREDQGLIPWTLWCLEFKKMRKKAGGKIEKESPAYYQKIMKACSLRRRLKEVYHRKGLINSVSHRGDWSDKIKNENWSFHRELEDKISLNASNGRCLKKILIFLEAPFFKFFEGNLVISIKTSSVLSLTL